MKKILLLLLLVACGPPEHAFSVCGVEAKIVGGDLAPADSRAAVNVSNFCSGVLIAPHVVLTAAHCKDPKFVLDNEGTKSVVWSAVEHPDFAYLTLTNDIQVLILEEPLLGPYATIAPATVGAGFITGFGMSDYEEFGTLREGTTVVRTILNNKVYTVPGCPDTCFGDSGGPLYQEGYLVALTSSGQGQSCGSGGVYTEVNPYIDWIDYVAGDFFTLL